MLSLILLFLAASACELVDSGLGMMYGTILSPLLMVCGYSPSEVVPAILLSQTVGGAVASVGHHAHRNADLSPGGTDSRVGAVVAAAGVVAVAGGAYVAIKIPPAYLRTYVGILVVVMGCLVVRPMEHRFAWGKIGVLGFASAFNKAMSGGGYGPLVASGLVLSGRKSKSAVAVTDLAEVPICVASLLAWVLLGRSFPGWQLYVPLVAGSVAGALLGPLALSRIKSETSVRQVVGYLAIVLGLGCVLGVLAA